MTRGPSPSTLRRSRKRVASASEIREGPRTHIRGLEENICSAFAPSSWAISSAAERSPAIDVWIPMRVLPSLQAGISGGGGASGRYSSPASNTSWLRWLSSAITSRRPGAKKAGNYGQRYRRSARIHLNNDSNGTPRVPQTLSEHLKIAKLQG